MSQYPPDWQSPYPPPMEQGSGPQWQQPPNYTQPHTYYQQPLKKRASPERIIATVLIVAFILGFGILYEVTQHISFGSLPTEQQGTWTTTQTFTGSGIQNTAIFSVPGDWKILWSCTPGSFVASEYNVQVFVYNSDNTLHDVAINAFCKSDTTSGETEEHQGGNIYLKINSEGAWTIQVQELQ